LVLMKVAVVHDWIVNIGGAEKVLKAILEVFPDADVYTLVYLKNTVKKLGIEGKVYSSFINGLPLAKRKILILFTFDASCCRAI